MPKIDKGKIGITTGGEWVSNRSYEILTCVGRNGKSYISLENNQNCDPETHPTKWMLSSDRGESLYQMMVRTGRFEGTEDEFLQEYEDVLQAARDVTEAAEATNVEVTEAENSRVTAENSRVTAENSRVNAENQRSSTFAGYNARIESIETSEATRISNENQRKAAEIVRYNAERARVVNEQNRVSNESGRVEAENARIAAEGSVSGQSGRAYAESLRVTAENDRQAAENQRTVTFSQSQTERAAAYQAAEGSAAGSTAGDGSRWGAFKSNEASRDAIVSALQNKLEKGEVVPALAANLASWAGSTQNANYTQENIVETTGGDLSIDSSVPATLVSIAAKTDFSATKLVATGFNLLRRATALNSGWYFMVPALPYGAINTATQPNGVLFTNEQGVNLRPIVRFKPLSQGVPTSVLDGVECPYTDTASGLALYRFYNPIEAGYLIVSGIDRSTTCAHIGWSKRYDEYISVTDPNDAGSEVNIAAGIHALHSYDKMLTVGNSADRIERTGDNQVTWHRLVDHVQPTWTTTPVESEGEPTGDYIHTATISGMKPGGAAAFETLDITLLVDGTTISFTDQNSTVENDYVKYELATEVTGTAAVSSSFSVEDWGLIIIEGAVGSAYINIAYAQGIPDSVRQMLSNIDNKTIPVIAEALLYLYNENKALRELLTGKDNAVLPYIKAQTIECNDMLTMGVPDVLVCSEEGAPSAANVPDNWDETTMTVWNGCPRKVGQQFVDKASGKVYYAIKVTGSTNDWVVLN